MIENTTATGSLDSVFEALSDEHRRRLLAALLEREQDRGTDWVPIPEAAYAGEEDIERLHVQLVHTHIPLLADAGYVVWDGDAHRTTRGPNFDEIRPALELFDEHAAELPYDWA